MSRLKIRCLNWVGLLRKEVQCTSSNAPSGPCIHLCKLANYRQYSSRMIDRPFKLRKDASGNPLLLRTQRVHSWREIVAWHSVRYFCRDRRLIRSCHRKRSNSAPRSLRMACKRAQCSRERLFLRRKAKSVRRMMRSRICAELRALSLHYAALKVSILDEPFFPSNIAARPPCFESRVWGSWLSMVLGRMCSCPVPA